MIQFQSLILLKKRDLKSKALATREASEAFRVLVEAARGMGPGAEEQELIDAVRKNKDVAMQAGSLSLNPMFKAIPTKNTLNILKLGLSDFFDINVPGFSLKF